MEHVVKADTYDRWTDGYFSIARYSWWEGKRGTYFVAYDLVNYSRRVNPKPVASFKEALALCK